MPICAPVVRVGDGAVVVLCRRRADYTLLAFSPSQLGLACFSVAAGRFCPPGWLKRVLDAAGCCAPPPQPLLECLDAVFAPRHDPRRSPEAISRV